MATLISPDRINSLKARVKAECQRRNASGSVASYGGTSYDYTNVPANGVTIAAEHRDKIMQPLKAINSTKINTFESQNTVTSNEDISLMESFITVLEKRDKTDGSGTDCNSGCTGMCYSTCTGTCRGSCTNACAQGCSNDCTGSCTNWCAENCEYNCYPGCGTGCTWFC